VADVTSLSDRGKGKRVVVWWRGSDDKPVIVVANFSDFTTPHALRPGAEYVVPGWPPTPAGRHWFEVTRGRDVTTGRQDRESIFAWKAKVYRLAPGDTFERGSNGSVTGMDRLRL
jgi:pullulanase